jgi:hypothetical protein
MKEVITVELDKADVEAAIEDMLAKHGYKVEKVDFKTDQFIGGIELSGVTATVTKNIKLPSLEDGQCQE